MAGLVPKRRTQQQIQRAEDQFLKQHDAYLNAWLKASQSGPRLRGRPPTSSNEVRSRSAEVRENKR
jgi:hypothetical protein